jgi:hypothetical protein
MNTTVTVETVHGLKDTFVVGSNGIVSVPEPTRPQEAKTRDSNATSPLISESVSNIRPSTT